MQNSRLIKVISVNTLLLSIFIGYYFLNLNYGIGIPCIFHELTGLKCPGCGITRCLFSILRLDFSSAIHYNVVVFFLVPFILIYFFHYEYCYVFNKVDKLYKNTPDFIYYLLIFILIIFCIIRNIM